jgi:hypothetical protein
VALQLRLENADDLRANGKDLAVINCFTVDAEGRMVPDASPMVSFNTNRLAVIAGTGSSIFDHVPPHIPERHMRAGLCAAAVRCTAPGTVCVYASAPGLATARPRLGHCPPPAWPLPAPGLATARLEFEVE